MAEKWTVERLRERVKSYTDFRWELIGSDIVSKKMRVRCTCGSGIEKEVGIREGWTVEDAVETPSRKPTQEKIEWEGKMWTLSALSKEHGLSVGTLHARLNRYGMNLSDALQKPVRGSGESNRT